jgi:hypothetical protein
MQQEVYTLAGYCVGPPHTLLGSQANGVRVLGRRLLIVGATGGGNRSVL